MIIVNSQRSRPAVMIDFSNQQEAREWIAINDSVMGGISQSQLAVEGKNVAFSGRVSLANNGGFASVRRNLRGIDLADKHRIRIKVKGDGRRYQLRLRTHNNWDGIAFTVSFTTQPDLWQTFIFHEREFIATHRGRPVSGSGEFFLAEAKQLGFLIADRKPGDFKLVIGRLDID